MSLIYGPADDARQRVACRIGELIRGALPLLSSFSEVRDFSKTRPVSGPCVQSVMRPWKSGMFRRCCFDSQEISLRLTRERFVKPSTANKPVIVRQTAGNRGRKEPLA